MGIFSNVFSNVAEFIRDTTNQWVETTNPTEFPEWQPEPPRTNRYYTNLIPLKAKETKTPIGDFQISNFANVNVAVPLVYGRRIVGARFITRPVIYNNKLVIACAWGYGVLDAIEQVLFDGKPVPDDVTVVNHVGGIEAADSTLVAAFAANDITFDDGFYFTTPPYLYNRGIGYSVLSIPDTIDHWPNISAIIRGRKVYDPRTATSVYTRTPALHFRDWIAADIWGPVLNISGDSSFNDLADYNEETVNGITRNQTDVIIDTQLPYETILQLFCEYSQCRIEWFPVSSRDIEVKINKPSSSVFSLDHSSIVKNSFKFKKESKFNKPNQVQVNYTKVIETDERKDWIDADPPAIVQSQGAGDGSEDIIESVVNLPWICRHEEAYNRALKRYNEIQLADLSIRVAVKDEGALYEVLDVGDITHKTLGPDAKPVILLKKQQVNESTWALDLYEYDPAIWSDDIEAEPTYSDTSYPDPNSPPTVIDIVLTEQVIKNRIGSWSSYIQATWDTDVTWPFIAGYKFQVLNRDNDVVYETICTGQAVSTPILPETYLDGNSVLQLETYTVRIAAFSTNVTGVFSDETIQLDTIADPPSDVPNFSGLEAGGVVRLSWDEAVDYEVNLLYEIRFGSVSVAWSSASVLDRVRAYHYETKSLPPGTYDFLIKAVDSFKTESENEARVTIEVTTDTDSYVKDNFNFTASVLQHIDNLLDRYAKYYYFVDSGDTWDNTFTSAMSTYTNELLSYGVGHATNKFVNSDFSSGSTGWTYVGDITFSGGACIFGGGTSPSYIYQNRTTIDDHIYIVKFTISSRTAGSVDIHGGAIKEDPLNIKFSTNGTHFIAVKGNGTTGSIIIYSNDNFAGTIDDFYVYENNPFLCSIVNDVTALTSGVWRANLNYAALQESGDGIVPLLEISDHEADYTDFAYYTPYQNLSVLATGRYAKIRFIADSGSSFLIVKPDDINTLDVSVNSRWESGEDTTNGSGWVDITLDDVYSKAVQIQATVINTSIARTVVVDAIDIDPSGTSSFRIYVFNSSGTAIASADVSWFFKGV